MNYLVETPSYQLVEQAGKDWTQLVELAKMAKEVGNNTQWLWADIALSVINNFGVDSLDEFGTESMLKKETLAKYSRVAKAWPPEKRQLEMSFSHHAIIATREDRFELINKIADRPDMTTEKLVVEMRKSGGQIDKNIVSSRVMMVRGDMETVMSWYNKILEKWPEILSDGDHLMFERMKQHYKKMMMIAEKVKEETLLD